MCQTSGLITRVILVKSAVSTYIPLPTRTWLSIFQDTVRHHSSSSSSSSSSIGTTARCELWPVEQYPSIFFYQPPTFSIFLLPTLEDLFLLPISILSWTVRYQLVEISLRLLPPLSNSTASHRMVVLVHRPGLRGHQISRPFDYSLWGNMKDMVYRQKWQQEKSNCRETCSPLTA